MDARIAGAIAHCQETLASAEDNARAQRWNRCGSDMYFAVFYAADAALMRQGIETRTHAHTQSELHKSLVRPGLLPTDLGKVYNELWELRSLTDYQITIMAAEADIVPLIGPAQTLIDYLLRLARA